MKEKQRKNFAAPNFGAPSQTDLDEPGAGLLAHLAGEASSPGGEQIWRSLLSSSADLIVLCDERGLVVEWNPAAEQITGLPCSEVLTRPLWEVEFQLQPAEVRTPQLLQQIKGQIQEILRVGQYPAQVDREEREIQRTDGTRRTLQAMSFIIPSGQGFRIGSIRRDISGHIQTERKLAQRLEMEQLVSRISARFVGSNDLDAEIMDSLAEIGSFCRADRVYVFLFSPDRVHMDNTHEWCAPGVSPQIENLMNMPLADYPWWMEHLGCHDFLQIEDISQMPPEAKGERQILESQEIKSLIVLPFEVRGALAGFVGLDNVRETKQWSEDDLALLRIFSNVLGSAIERQRVEAALRQSENRFRALAEITASAVFLYQQDRLVYANPAMEAITGYPVEELLGMEIWRLIHPDFLPLVQARRRARRAGQAIATRNELKILTKSGEERWIDYSVAYTELEGAPLTVGTGFDISEHKRIEESLRESEQRYRSLVEASPDAIVMTDLKGEIIFCNTNAALLVGRSDPSDLLGVNGVDLLAPEERERTAEEAQRMLESGGARNLRCQALHASGRGIPLEVSLATIPDASGQLKAILSVSKDISEQRRTEEKLKYLSNHDPLTELYNRRYFEEEMVRLQQGRRFPVSIIMLDVDNLKQTNDDRGHEAGDQLLRRTADLLRMSFRAEDVVARIGGDEFAVLLPLADERNAQEALERLRSNLQAANLAHAGAELSLSLGCATAHATVDEVEQLSEALKRADKSMYRDKSSRNPRSKPGRSQEQD